MFAHPLVPVALDCHCTVHVPVPPLGVAVRVTLPPTQTVEEDGVMLTEGSGVTVTLAWALAVQPNMPVTVTL